MFPNHRRTRKISTRINAMKINRQWCLDSHALCSSCLREINKQNMIGRCTQQEKDTLFFPLLLPSLFVFSTVTQFHPKKTSTQVASNVSLNKFIRDENGLTFPTITEINHTRISRGPSLYSSTENKKSYHLVYINTNTYTKTQTKLKQG